MDCLCSHGGLYSFSFRLDVLAVIGGLLLETTILLLLVSSNGARSLADRFGLSKLLGLDGIKD